MAASATPAPTSAARSGAGHPSSPSADTRRVFRPELQGLRALAVGLVVVYHVWIGRVSGGVDVFFVISGFLLAGQMTRAAERNAIDLRAYWGKTAKRLIPPTVVVLVGTVVAAFLWLPESRWPQTVREVLASSLFFQNWRLAADSVDYYAAHNSASVVQHLWSLSIQGQFYLAFPIVIVVVALVARRLSIRVRPAVIVALLLLSAGSLAYSIVLTMSDQKLAYFHTATRLWEFTLGGLLAIVIDRLVLPRGIRLLLGWAGVVGLVMCGVALNVDGGFPGYLALWPVLCALAILVAGRTDHAAGADRILSSSTMQYLGNISFPLYLWHWPVLLFALAVTRRTELGWLSGGLVIAASVLLSVGTRHLVEQPIGKASIGTSSPWGNHRFALLALVPILVLTLAWQGVVSAQGREGLDAAPAEHPGAMVLTPGFEGRPVADVSPAPAFAAVTEDWTQLLPECRTSAFEPSMEVCASAVDGPPLKRIVVIGDSHMQQFLPALLPYAAEQRWQVIEILKGACSFGIGDPPAGEDPTCGTWNDAALKEMASIRPDAVVTLATREVRSGLTENTPPSFVAGWKALGDLGIPVVGVRDNPRFDYSPSACVEGQLTLDLPCSHPREALYAPVPPYERTAGVTPNVAFLDPSNLICTATECPPEIGNVLVYLDNNHLTATFSRTMSPAVGPEVARLLRW